MRSSASAEAESHPHGRSATSKIFTFASAGGSGWSGSTSTIFFQTNHVRRSEPPITTVPRGRRMVVAIFLREGQLLPELVAFLFPDNFRVTHAHDLSRIYYRIEETQNRLRTCCTAVSHVWEDHETQRYMLLAAPCLIRVQPIVRFKLPVLAPASGSCRACIGWRGRACPRHSGRRTSR